MLASKFFHIDGTKADFKLNKSICDTKFIVYFRGHNGHQGHKGHLFSPVFFPWARVEISRGKLCVGTHWRLKSENYKKRVFYKVFYL